MRLIDADKITITRQVYVGALTLKERLRRLLESQPTVEAEPVRHGHWEKPQRHGVITYDEHAYAECSCCHKPQYLARGMNYCPNCGAKMDLEKENEIDR